MKKVLGLAVFSMISCFHIFAGINGSEAAKEITVETITKDISRGKQPGLKIDIFQASKKDVANDWAKLIRKDTKSKVEEQDAEVFIIGAHIPEITVAPLNIYAVINDYIDHIEVNVFFETPDGFITKENSDNAASVQLPLNELPEGVYFMQLQTANGMYMKKLIVGK